MTTGNETLTTDALVDEALALGEGLGRPLRYVQLNSFYNGSTGTIMRDLHRGLTEHGVDSYTFWGRRHETVSAHERCVATRLGYLSHGALVRLDDRMGFHSKNDTRRLLHLLDEIDPDVVHLHNVHGYWVNVEMLFGWLASHRCQVRWTLHDCWAFTGHCAHFTYVKCAQWMTHCAYSEKCPQLDTYPKTVCRHNCARNFEDKRRIFTSIPPERMTLITPSRWLEGLVEQSFLGGCRVEVRHNTVDRTVFKPTPSDFRERYGIGDRFMVLGVASPWTLRKGLGDLVRLAGDLDGGHFAIVLVGLSEMQAKDIKKSKISNSLNQSDKYTELLHAVISYYADIKGSGINNKTQSTEGCEIVTLQRTSSQQDLASIYSAADLFVNPTVEDNYPTVNLEAEACGTPVLTYDTGGCSETISLPCSRCL